MPNTNGKKRTTLSLPTSHHEVLVRMSNSSELEMSRVVGWCVSAQIEITNLRDKVVETDPKFYAKLNSLLSSRTKYFLDTMSESIDK